MNGNFALENAGKKIIKNGDLTADSAFTGRVLKHQIVGAEEKARKIVRRADESARSRIAEAEAEAEAIRNEAYKNGHEESVKELLADLLAAKQQRSEALYDIEREVLKLAVKIAEKIIGREIELDQAVRAEIVENALRQARQREIVTVRVNANDLPLISKMREQMEGSGGIRHMDFVSDRGVGAGGCLIESSSDTIDARLETQLRVIEKILLDQVKDQSDKP